jgi:sugar phosphate isomerase/epimerase
MKIGIDSYSYHRYFGEVYDNQKAPQKRMSYEDFLRRAIELGVDGVSLETCFFESFDEDYLKNLRGIMDEGNLECVLAWGHPLGLEGGANAAAVDDMLSHVKTCEILNSKVMRIVGSHFGLRNEPHGPQMEKIVKLMKDPVKVAEDNGIRLAMENHYDFTSDEMLEIVEGVGSAYLGITYDTGNSLRIGDSPSQSIKKLAKHVYATHTKDVAPIYGGNPQDWFFFASVPVGKGVVDIPAIARELEVTGYRGLLAIEIDYLHPDWEDEDTAVAESVEYLEQLRARVSN